METKQHPLINKIDSKHYDTVDGEPAIKRFERKYSVKQLAAWAMISAAKYDDPARANKGQVEADARKSKTYHDYYEMLMSIPYALWNTSAEKAYNIMNWDMQY